MLPISTKEPLRYCPAEESAKAAQAALDKAAEAAEANPGAEAENALAAARQAAFDAAAAVPGAPAYLLEVPAMRRRIAFSHAVAAAGATFAPDAELFAILREGIREIVAPEQAAELAAIVDSWEAVPAEDRGKDEQLASDFDTIARTVRARYPRFAQAEASRGHYLNLAPLIAASMFLIGREGERPLPRRAGVVPDEALETIPQADLALVGFRLLEMMRPSADASKNSASGSPSPASPTPSTAASGTPPAPGSSAASDTSATPA